MQRSTEEPLGLWVIDKAQHVKCTGTRGCSRPAQHRCTNRRCRRSLCERHSRRRDERVCHRCHMCFAQTIEATPLPTQSEVVRDGIDPLEDDETPHSRHATGTIVFVSSAMVRHSKGRCAKRGIRLVQRIRSRSDARPKERISVIVAVRHGVLHKPLKRPRVSSDSRQLTLIA